MMKGTQAHHFNGTSTEPAPSALLETKLVGTDAELEAATANVAALRQKLADATKAAEAKAATQEAEHEAEVAVLRRERDAAIEALETDKAALQAAHDDIAAMRQETIALLGHCCHIVVRLLQGGLVSLRGLDRGVALPAKRRHLGLVRRRHGPQRVMGGRRLGLQGRYVFVCVRGGKGCMGLEDELRWASLGGVGASWLRFRFCLRSIH